MTSLVTYRCAAVDDAERIFDLIREEQNPDVDWDNLVHLLTKGLCVIAERENELVGFRLGYRFCGDIFTGDNFLIRHRYRGQGIGTTLSEFMFDELRKRGFKLAVTGNSDYYQPVVGSVEDGVWHRPTELYLRLGYDLVAETELSRLFIKRL